MGGIGSYGVKRVRFCRETPLRFAFPCGIVDGVAGPNILPVDLRLCLSLFRLMKNDSAL